MNQPTQRAPNLPLIIACLMVIGTEVPRLMGNPPTQTVEQGFQGLQDALDAGFDRHQAFLDQKFQKLKAKMEIDRRVISARTMNSSAPRSGRGDDAILYPVPLPNGDMPGEVFPATLGALKNLPEYTLDSLILRYRIATGDNLPQGVDDKRKLVARHFGVRLDM